MNDKPPEQRAVAAMNTLMAAAVKDERDAIVSWLRGQASLRRSGGESYAASFYEDIAGDIAEWRYRL